MESKELIVRENSKLGYYILGIVFVLSVIGAILYFSSVKGNSKVKTVDEYIYSGEIIYVSGENVAGYDEPILIQKKAEMKNNEKEISVEVPSKPTGTVAIRQLEKNQPMVALTFDDGPNPTKTLAILDVLKKYGARATFFDIGNLIELYPDTVRKELEAGCEVGGHSYTHANLNNLSQSEIQEEMSKLEKVYQSITGEKLRLVRPTFGNVNTTVRNTVKYPLINWNVDSRDWELRDTDKILNKIYETKDFDGKIIIMHVLYDATVEALDKLIPTLQKQGYQFVTISEMASYKGVTLNNGEVYYGF